MKWSSRSAWSRLPAPPFRVGEDLEITLREWSAGIEPIGGNVRCDTDAIETVLISGKERQANFKFKAKDSGRQTFRIEIRNKQRTTVYLNEIFSFVVLRSDARTEIADQPVYDGKTLSQWLSGIRTERKPERLTEAIRAVRSMIDDDSNASLVDASMEAVFKMVRKFGTRNSSPADAELNQLAWMTLVRMPQDRLLDRVIREVKEGNSKSRDFMFFFLYPTISVKGIGSNAPWDEAREFLDKLHASTEFTHAVSTSGDRKWATELLFKFSEENAFDQQPQLSRFNGDRQFFQESFKAFSAETTGPYGAGGALTFLKDPFLASMCAMRLAKIAPETEGLVEGIRQILSLPTDAAEKNAFATRTLCVLALERLGDAAAPATPELLELFGSSFVHRESQYRHSGWYRAVPGAQFQDQEFFAKAIVRTLGNIGPEAKGGDTVPVENSRRACSRLNLGRTTSGGEKTIQSKPRWDGAGTDSAKFASDSTSCSRDGVED